MSRHRLTTEQRLRIPDALDIAERDDAGQCAGCTVNLAEEGDTLCWYCRAYANDCAAGLFIDWDDD